MQNFKAILWDCDGVLIDSEHLACGLSAQTLSEAGFPISAQDFTDRFCGQHKKQIEDTIRAEAGFDVFARIDKEAKHKARQALFKAELKAIAGIHDTLDRLPQMKMAIASGSDMERLEYTLRLTDLWERFLPHIYNADHVPHGKPAPDLFLYAAKQLGVAPQDCLVMEDSRNGVRAGVAAGMTVFGFTGGSHIVDKAKHNEALTALGANLVFSEMSALPSLLRQQHEKKRA